MITSKLNKIHLYILNRRILFFIYPHHYLDVALQFVCVYIYIGQVQKKLYTWGMLKGMTYTCF